MKKYKATHYHRFEIVEGNHARPLPHIVRHNPTGMGWGFIGDGPSDLALSILTDAVGKDTAERMYKAYMLDVIANLDYFDDGFVIDEQSVLDWVKAHSLTKEG